MVQGRKGGPNHIASPSNPVQGGAVRAQKKLSRPSSKGWSDHSEANPHLLGLDMAAAQAAKQLQHNARGAPALLPRMRALRIVPFALGPCPLTVGAARP